MPVLTQNMVISGGSKQDPTLKSNMQQEYLRIASFNQCKLTLCTSPLILAKQGFYYTGDGNSDRITCFRCNMSLSDWSDRTTPFEDHNTSCQPNKNMLMDKNIPLTVKEDITLRMALERYIGCKSHNSSKDSEISCQQQANGETKDFTKDLRPSFTANHIIQYPLNLPDIPEQTNKTPPEPREINLQEVINRVPKTHKLSQPVYEPNSSDPRKKGELKFLDRMRSEKERLKTFYDWPDGAWQTPKVLAVAGFFYTGSSDRCQCAFCRGFLRNWEPNDVPIQEHARHFAECPFVRGKDVGNIHIQNGHLENNDPSGPKANVSGKTSNIPSEITATAINVGHGIITQPVKHARYALEAVRLSTFDHPSWPNHMKPSPELLARAGFFYTEKEDSVKCFYCDGTLNKWGATDDPLSEHARWFPECPFVLMLKNDTSVQGHKESTNVIPTASEDHGPTEGHTCRVCMDQKASIVFLPCSHLVTCTRCAPALNTCPVCRQRVQGSVRIYLS